MAGGGVRQLFCRSGFRRDRQMDRQTDILSCVLQMGQELDQGRAQALKVRVSSVPSPEGLLVHGSLTGLRLEWFPICAALQSAVGNPGL